MSDMNRKTRLKIIKNIQKNRDSKVITYLTSDRQGVHAQIGSDAIRPLYEHIKSWGFNGVPKIDLFLYSRGGGVEVPWPLITMFREYCTELNVLIPFRAHSATTMISLGADHIIMGKKGELGPIDPQITKFRNDQAEPSEILSVEDIMSYISFIKDKAGLSDQDAISKQVSILAEKMNPWSLGSMYRTYSHIRMTARKLLISHKENIDERKIDAIIETLAEKTYFHGHSIGSGEAAEIGLPIIKADENLDGLMWALFVEYEKLLKLDEPLDSRSILPADKDELDMPIYLAVIESEQGTDVFSGDFKIKRTRQFPSQINLNLNIPLQLPPNIDQQAIPAELNAQMQALLQNFQAQISQIVQTELNKQAPLGKIEAGLFNASWKNVTELGI